MPIRDDFIMRMVAQLAAAVARMLGLRNAGQHEEALREAEQAHSLLGLPAGLLDRVDAATLASILGHQPAKLTAVADVLDQEAAAMTALGDPRAEGRRALAAGLRQRL